VPDRPIVSVEQHGRRADEGRLDVRVLRAGKGTLPVRASFTSVRTKIVAALLLASAVTTAVGAVAVHQDALVAGEGERIYSQALIPNGQLSALRETVVQARFDVVSRQLAVSPVAYTQADANLRADQARVTTISRQYADTALSDAQRARLATFTTAWEAYKVVRDDKLTPLLTSGDLAGYEKIRQTELIPLVNTSLSALNSLTDLADQRARAAVERAQQAERTARNVVLALLGAGLVLSLALGTLVANSILRPVRRVRDVLDAVAHNDLTQVADVRTRDELGQMATALNTSITHLRTLHATLSHQVLHDGLTGLLNRSALMEALEETMQPGAPGCAVLFIDLDGFKAVNDHLGHAGGDTLLALTATRISRTTRGADVVARLGGDEFVIICRGGDDIRAAATATAARVITDMAADFVIGGEVAQVGASIGVALSRTGLTAAAMLHQADTAMYQAKTSGRGCYVIHDDLVAVAAPRLPLA
jgi:diguanylate cyclase (GGDEF)-like protein